MDWFKLESRYHDDKAITAVGEKGEVLFIRSIAYATDFETKGFIPNHQLTRFGLTSAKTRADALVREGLWTPVHGGWQITSYERIQAEMLKIMQRRQADKERKRLVRGQSAAASADESTACPQNGVSVSGYVTEPKAKTGDLPPNPRQSGGRRCTRHGRPRQGCDDCSMPANATILDPPCGNCSPSRRLEDEHGNDLGPCPSCHPGRRTA